jgi:hypothetical protein
MTLEKYSFGIGDRFGHQGVAQLRALQQAEQRGVKIVPVWNKSYREHSTTGTSPSDTRREADNSVKECNWLDSYYVDADHIGSRTVDLFMDSSDFFTLDVADFIGKKADEKDLDAFVQSMRKSTSSFPIPGVQTTTRVTEEDLYAIGRTYLLAVKEAGKVYRRIKEAKGADNFVTEVSTDETNEPQTPAHLFFILGALAQEGIPIQTIAPKFTGRFLKGIDYVGAVEQFTREFEEDLLVIARAIRTFDLPKNLKLSVHSGSDKFSLYPSIQRAIRKHDVGLHLKTAGTTWLEELIGLAMSGGQGLEIAQAIYAAAYERIDELCRPYETVIDIDRSKLPDPQKVRLWGSQEFVSALRHDWTDSRYNLHFRQLLHVAYKIAAEMGDQYVRRLEYSREVIASNVTQNLFERHIAAIFLGPR